MEPWRRCRAKRQVPSIVNSSQREIGGRIQRRDIALLNFKFVLVKVKGRTEGPTFDCGPEKFGSNQSFLFAAPATLLTPALIAFFASPLSC
jgi:hypothetical protein